MRIRRGKNDEDGRCSREDEGRLLRRKGVEGKTRVEGWGEKVLGKTKAELYTPERGGCMTG